MQKLAMILILILSHSCASTTIIKTNNPQTKIYVNGNFIGQGSGVYSDRRLAFMSTDVELKTAGCQDSVYTITKNERLDVLPLISGFLLVVPFLWVMKYQAQRFYEIDCSAK